MKEVHGQYKKRIACILFFFTAVNIKGRGERFWKLNVIRGEKSDGCFLSKTIQTQFCFAWIVTGSQYGERNKAIFLCWFEGPKMIKLETLFSRGFSLVHLWESQTRKNFMLASADFLICGWVEFQHYCQCCGKKQVRIFCGRAAAQGGRAWCGRQTSSWRC